MFSKFTKATLCGLLICAPAVAAPFDWQSLQVIKDVPAGRWQTSFRFLPGNPNFPPKSEQFCASSAQVQAFLESQLKPLASSGECPANLVFNAPSRAEIHYSCPAVPQIGIPAITVRYEVKRPSPALPTRVFEVNDGKTLMRTTATYLGKC